MREIISDGEKYIPLSSSFDPLIVEVMEKRDRGAARLLESCQ